MTLWVTEIAGEASDNPFMYTGREHDDTGLYYYRARYYSPEMGRFISEDPIEFVGGDVNFYTYVKNNPTNYIDPTGEYAQWVVITAAVVLTAIVAKEAAEPIINAIKHPEEPEEPLPPHIEMEVCHPVDPRTLSPQRTQKQPPVRPKPRNPVRPSRAPVRR